MKIPAAADMNSQSPYQEKETKRKRPAKNGTECHIVAGAIKEARRKLTDVIWCDLHPANHETALTGRLLVLVLKIPPSLQP